MLGLLSSRSATGGALGRADRGTDEGAAVGVDVELEVAGEAPSGDFDDQLRAVADPLGAREEGLEALAVRRGVGWSSSPLRDPHAVSREDTVDRVPPQGDAVVKLDVIAEGDKAATPALPGGEHGLDLRDGRSLRLQGEVDLLGDLGPLAAEPVLQGAEREPGGLGEVVEGEVSVLGGEVEDEAAERVGVAAPLAGARHAPGVGVDEVEDGAVDGAERLGRSGVGRGLRRPARRSHDVGQRGLHRGLRGVGSGPAHAQAFEGGGGGGRRQTVLSEHGDRGEEEAGEGGTG